MIITLVSLAAAIAVIFVVAYDAGHNQRAKAQAAQAMEPVTHLGTLASQYQVFAGTATHAVGSAAASYTGNENSNLTAAESALLAEVSAERSFDNSLTAWLASWKQTYSAAVQLQNNENQANVTITIPYKSSVIKRAQSLIQADQASEAVLTQQARSNTLFQLRSFNGSAQAAQTAVEAQVILLRKALGLPPP